VTLTQKQIDHFIGREHREFFNIDGKRVSGLSTQEKRCWWVPEDGSSLWEGTHLFESKADALRTKRKSLEAEKAAIERELGKLEREGY
jgi:hypothetical protein